jgi:hypothetical protein
MISSIGKIGEYSTLIIDSSYYYKYLRQNFMKNIEISSYFPMRSSSFSDPRSEASGVMEWEKRDCIFKV